MHILALTIFLFLSLAEANFNSTCKFSMADKELYDLSSFRLAGPKDYTYNSGDILYVINFCGPAIKECNGIEGAFASLWNRTTFECVQVLSENDAQARYIDAGSPSRGVILEYKGDRAVTMVEIECDQAFEKAGVIKAAKVSSNPDVHKFWMKSKHVCRNFAEAETEGWGWFPRLLFLAVVGLLLYFVIGICINMRSSSYVSFSESVPNKEFWLTMVLRVKEVVNKVTTAATGSAGGSSAESAVHTPTV